MTESGEIFRHRNPVKQLGVAFVPFAMMYDPRISKGACCLYHILGNCDTTNGAVPDDRVMASRLCCTAADIDICRKELERAGYITIEQGKNGSKQLVLEDISKIAYLRDLAERILEEEGWTL